MTHHLQKEKETENFTIFSNRNRSLLRRRPERSSPACKLVAHKFTGFLFWHWCSCFVPVVLSMLIRVRDTLSVRPRVLGNCTMEEMQGCQQCSWAGEKQTKNM